MKKNWYVVRTLSGKEQKVKDILEEIIKQKKLEHLFGQILIPIEYVVEIKFKKRKKSKRKMFPGYILIKMIITNETWYIIKNISQTLGFVSATLGKPTPVNKNEITFIFKKIKESSHKPKPKILFDIGKTIRVKSGPFYDLNGTVEEVNYDKNRLCVGVLIFGRSTPIDLDFSQVEKT